MFLLAFDYLVSFPALKIESAPYIGYPLGPWTPWVSFLVNGVAWYDISWADLDMIWVVEERPSEASFESLDKILGGTSMRVVRPESEQIQKKHIKITRFIWKSLSYE